MKKIMLLLIVLLLSFSFTTGCSNDDKTNDAETPSTDQETSAGGETSSDKETADVTWLTFTNDEHNFTLEYPSDWTIVDSVNYGIVLRPYEETQTTFYVDTYTSMYSDVTMSDYVDEMMGNLMRIRDTATFEDPYNIDINGYPFTGLVYQETADDGEVYHYQEYFTANGYGYIMYYVIPENEYDAIAPIMDEIAMTFQFTK